MAGIGRLGGDGACGRPAYGPWLLLSPALLLLGLFVFWPVIYLLGLSFTRGSFTRAGVQWVGLHHYSRLVSDPDFWQALGNSLGFTLATVLPSLGLGLGLALLLNRRQPGAGVARTLYFLPSVTSLVAAGLAFRWLFQTEGPVNGALGWLGFAPFPWLADPWGARAVLVLLSLWVQVGFNWVVLLAGLQAIPHQLYEAAGLDGATAWQRFWWITLPNLRPALVFATVTTTLFSLRSFEPVYVVTGGGPLGATTLLVYYIYDQAFAQFDLGYAAAAATVLFGSALGLLFWLGQIIDVK